MCISGKYAYMLRLYIKMQIQKKRIFLIYPPSLMSVDDFSATHSCFNRCRAHTGDRDAMFRWYSWYLTSCFNRCQACAVVRVVTMFGWHSGDTHLASLLTWKCVITTLPPKHHAITIHFALKHGTSTLLGTAACRSDLTLNAGEWLSASQKGMLCHFCCVFFIESTNNGK